MAEAAAEAAAPGQLEGRLVEIVGVEGGPDQEVDPNGMRGRAYEWKRGEGRYLVETFAGMHFDLPEAKVCEYEPAAADEGGFDVPWPVKEAHEQAVFSLAVTERLQEKGYCLVQTFEDPGMRLEAKTLADCMKLDFTKPKQELEEAYLGRAPGSKLAFLEGDVNENVGLAHYNDRIKTLHMLLLPLTSDYLGFTPWTSRIGTMFRQVCANEDEEVALDRGLVNQADIQSGEIERHIDFVKRRRLCMIYMVNGCASIELHPQDSSEVGGAVLTVEAGQLLIFRHDLMGYSYESDEVNMPGSLALQAWIVEPPAGLYIMKVDGAEEDDQDGLRGPPVMNGPGLSTIVSSLHCHFAGDLQGYEQAWLGFVGNIDGYIVIPNLRFDLDYYYSEDGDYGKTRTKHSALVLDSSLEMFDNVFYEWSEDEAYQLGLSLRITIDTGFQCMYHAGFSKEDLMHQRISFYLGHQNDEQGLFGYTPNAQLQHFLDLRGRTCIADTACSSALVAVCMGHQDVLLDRADAVLVAGVGILMSVGPYIAMSSGRMISSRGRSVTFDHSADGYGRGEGCAAGFLEKPGSGRSELRKQAKMKEPYEMGRFASSMMNQDGRSASITAPSGPAQSACVRGSLKEAGLTPDQTLFSECHGTGTALGDPIEVGSTRIVNDPYDRATPLSVGAAKTQVGHLELGAGAVGFLRAVLVLNHACVPPNNHIKQLNEHFAIEGFPLFMPCEALDVGQRNNFDGVQSFGFGGTNARAELWGKTRSGHLHDDNQRKMQQLAFVEVQCPRCLGPMCHMCGVAIQVTALYEGKHHCSSVRKEFQPYECCSLCYSGGYQLKGAGYRDWANEGDRVYAVGTWSGWSEFEEMNKTDDGSYVCAIRLGETRREEFRITVGTDFDHSIHPVAGRANQLARIVGPADDGSGLNWLIDGTEDDVPEGTVYKITFEWNEDGRTIDWEPTEELLPSMTRMKEYLHKYSVLGACTGGMFSDMAPAGSEDGGHSWEAEVTIPRHGEAEFVIARDHDMNQMVYPMNPELDSDFNVLAGPDGQSCGQTWKITGPADSKAAVKLSTVNGDIAVTVSSETDGTRAWKTAPHRYFVVGTFTGWVCNEMEADPDNPSIHRCWLTIGDSCAEEFQISLWQNFKKTLYPIYPNSPPGMAIVCGPADNGYGLHWEIGGAPGQMMEIVLDMGAEDKRAVVTCEPYEMAGQLEA